MKPDKHNLTLKYVPDKKEWAIYDDGVFHSDGYKTREIAQDNISSILGNNNLTKKDLIRFTKEWKRQINSSTK